MKSKSLRIIGAMLCIVMVMGLFAGCGKTEKPEDQTDKSSADKTPDTTKETSEDSDPKPDKSDEKVKLTVWYAVSGASGEAFEEMIKKYEAENENVDIELSYSGKYADTATKVSAALASGTEPDVALMAAGPLYTGGRGDFFIEEKIDEPDFDKDDVFPGVWDYAKYNGRICAIPYGISTQVLYYNKNILDKAGIDTNNPPETWEELYEMAKLAQKDGNINNSDDFWGFEVSDVPWLFKTMLSQNENPIIETEGTDIIPVYDDDKAVEVANWWKKMCEEKIMPVGQHSNAEKKFLAGNVAFIVATSNRIQRWAGEETVSLGAFPMPYFKKESLALGGNVLVIFGDDEATKEGSWDLVKYLTSAENQTEFALKTGYLPIRESGIELPIAKEKIENNPMYEIAFNQLKHTWSYWHFEQMGTMDGILFRAVEEIEKGVSTSPEDALSKAVKDLEKELD